MSTLRKRKQKVVVEYETENSDSKSGESSQPEQSNSLSSTEDNSSTKSIANAMGSPVSTDYLTAVTLTNNTIGLFICFKFTWCPCIFRKEVESSEEISEASA